MTPLGHTGIGLLAGIVLTKIVPGVDPKTILVSTTIGSVCLDLDLLYTFSKRGLDTLDEKAGGHRYYFTHTPFFVLALGLVLSIIINITVGLFITFGAMLHLIIDTFFFPEGINFTYPFKEYRIRLFAVKKTPSAWASKPIAQVDNWKMNYLSSPLFWIFEVLPTILAVALAISILYKS